MSATVEQKLGAAQAAAKLIAQKAFEGRVGHGNTPGVVHRNLTRDDIEYYALAAISEYERRIP